MHHTILNSYIIYNNTTEISDKMTLNTIIMFPTTPTSLILGKQLLAEDHNILLYCPNEVHRKQAGSIPDDLRIAALGLEVKVVVVANLDKFGDMDFILFPNLDLMPHEKRSDFALTCRDLFR